MQSLEALTHQLLDELGKLVCTSTTRDSETISRRVKHEGLSFLTITLPDFCKDFQKSLDRGFVANDVFIGFRRCGSGGHGRLPAFLQGFSSLVFDTASGLLLDKPSSEAIFCVRQLTMLHAKVQLPCGAERDRKAFLGYVECERKVREFDRLRTPEMVSAFQRMALILFGDVLSEMDRKVYQMEGLVPKHGPGSTQERVYGNAKWHFREWPERLEKILPARDMVIPNERHFPLLETMHFPEPGAERPVRVITVPKTLKTPRIIAIEPVAMQYAQQAIGCDLVELLESDSLVRGLIGFSDQGPNQDLAKKGSLLGELATLDLSSASDLVSNQLVRAMLERFPHLAEAVDACRSRKADVPGHGVLRLAKFASMGSALCFPIEAMVFLTVCFIGIQSELNKSLKRHDVSRFLGAVRIYGDDIIVPVEYVRSVIDHLHSFGFEVGTDKSFWTGRFRESCGREYYNGDDVSVVKVRRVFPSSRRNVEETISLVALRNLFYEKGLWQTAGWLDKKIEGWILPFYPRVHPSSPVVGRHSYLGYQVDRVRSDTQSHVVRGYVVNAPLPLNATEEIPALLKFLTRKGVEPFDKDHLERSGRPDAVYLKLRWASPF